MFSLLNKAENTMRELMDKLTNSELVNSWSVSNSQPNDRLCHGSTILLSIKWKQDCGPKTILIIDDHISPACRFETWKFFTHKPNSLSEPYWNYVFENNDVVVHEDIDDLVNDVLAEIALQSC